MEINESIKLKLLLGSPFQINDICTIKPLTLRQIVEIGHDKYNYYLSNLTAEVEDYNIPNIDSSQYTYWDVLITNMVHGDIGYYQMVIEAMNLFVGDGIDFDRKNGWFYIKKGNEKKDKNEIKEKKEISKETFDVIRQVLRWQNCISETKQIKSDNPVVIEMEKKLKEMRKKYASCNTDDILNFEDIISSLCCKHPSINLLNIKDMTIYQIINQFKRINMVDDYHINIEALLHGAGSDNNKKLKHWSGKITN